MNDFAISLPTDEETSLLRQEQYDTTWIDRLRKTIDKLLDPDQDTAQQIREIIIGSLASPESVDESQSDEHGVVDILGHELDSNRLEGILQNLKAC